METKVGRVLTGHGLYVGLRFKNRAIYSSVTDDNVVYVDLTAGWTLIQLDR